MMKSDSDGLSMSQLNFSGDPEDYTYWAIKMKAYLKEKTLWDSIKDNKDSAMFEAGAQIKEESHREKIWNILVQRLDRRSLMMLMQDCEEDGVKAWKLLQSYYSSTGKPRIMRQYLHEYLGRTYQAVDRCLEKTNSSRSLFKAEEVCLRRDQD
eukprot:GHVQ01029904.1.p1 GENE.GHVQ01029904.1~~GHVQ01029904.1.p1  ORF type:complete len:153 (-),score=24.13 GHVQ01029904.1:438-896(-)